MIHLASNPDIARAADRAERSTSTRARFSPTMSSRRCASHGVGRILYASGSGVYGDLGETEADEDYGPLVPISTYGASKLAGEALISSYCHMFDLTAAPFASGTSSGRGRPTASASTSCARCSPTRRACDPRRRKPEQVLHPRRGRDRRGAARRMRRRRRALPRLQRRHRRLHHRARDRRPRRRVRRPRPGRGRVRVHGRRPRVEGRRTGGAARTERIRALGWAPTRRSREALRESMAAMLAELAPGGCERRSSVAAVFLDRDGVLTARRSSTVGRTPSGDVDELELLPGVEDACAALRERGLRAHRRHEPARHRPRDTDRSRRRRDQRAAARAAAAGRDRRLPARRRRRLPLPQAQAWNAARRGGAPGTSTSRASFMVGDRWRDVEAGRAGLQHRLHGPGYTEPLPERPDATSAIWRSGRLDPRAGRGRDRQPRRACVSRSSPTAPTARASRRCARARGSRGSRPTRR